MLLRDVSMVIAPSSVTASVTAGKADVDAACGAFGAPRLDFGPVPARLEGDAPRRLASLFGLPLALPALLERSGAPRCDSIWMNGGDGGGGDGGRGGDDGGRGGCERCDGGGARASPSLRSRVGWNSQ